MCAALSCPVIAPPPPHCPIPVLLPLISDFLAKPLLSLHLPCLARTDSVSNQQAKARSKTPCFRKVLLSKATDMETRQTMSVR